MANLLQMPEFLWSFGVFIAGAGVAIAMIIKEQRPRDSFNPGLIPTTPLMLAGLVVAILALVHILNLAGVQTGR